ncbi:LysR family transcriptional regulator [Marinobacter hydrocarbonoclasticus]|nr:LysR family transcriptional regulator [Marinobacter nauticus]
MKYTLKQLMVFDAIATLGSVSQAADKLALTQSATSMSLSQLEKMLGHPLFERVGKRMILTHWGQWLRPKARGLISDARQIELGFSGQHLLSGEIRLGASQTGAEHLVPELISRIDSDFPEIRVKVDVANTEAVIEGVLKHRFQLGVIEGRCDDARIAQHTWCYDHLAVVVGKHHPYAQLDRISLTQLEQAKWVLRERGAGTRAIFDSALHGLIDNLNVRHEYEQVSILRALVANGNYLSCLPYLEVEAAVARGELVCLKVPELNMERRLSFIWRADSAAHPLRDCLMAEARHIQKRRALRA